MLKSLKGVYYFGLLILELLVPEKKNDILLENYTKYLDDFSCWFSGERSLPFGLLVAYAKHNGADTTHAGKLLWFFCYLDVQSLFSSL